MEMGRESVFGSKKKNIEKKNRKRTVRIRRTH